MQFVGGEITKHGSGIIIIGKGLSWDYLIIWEWIIMIGNKWTAEDVIGPITLFLCLSPHIRDSPSLEWDKSNVINLETCESKNNGTHIWLLLLF